jgi:hypothetical protein
MLFRTKDLLVSLACVALITSCGSSSFRSAGSVKTPESESKAGSNSGGLGTIDSGGTGDGVGDGSTAGAQGAGADNVKNGLGQAVAGGGTNQSGGTNQAGGSATGGGSGTGNGAANGSNTGSNTGAGGAANGSTGGGSSGGTPPNPVVVQPPPPPPSPPAPPTPEQVVENACNSRPKSSATEQVVFSENIGSRCAFGRDGNMSMKNAALAARIERSFAVGIPKSRIVCSMSTSSEGSQTVRYDDQLFLSLNDNLIMTRSAAFSSLNKQGNGFYRYEWDRLRGQGTGSLGSPFCAEGVSCQLPQTEKSGSFGFSLDNSANKRLFGSLLGQDLSFRLVITGDDNLDSDCQLYNSITMKINYTYVNN